MTDLIASPETDSATFPERRSTARTFLMCPPVHFTVSYEINEWMDMSVPVDTDLAVAQWETLRDTYVSLGHTVHTLTPEPGLPDMVFSANGAFSVGGIVYGAKFKYAERKAEATAHKAWYANNKWNAFVAGTFVNEGEGDFTYLPARNLVLAGWGFRTDRRSHVEAEAVLDCPVVSLELVDPRFYHLDVALFVLDDNSVCYFPGAFSEKSRFVLEGLFPDALIATEEDALAFGLNAVSDGYNVVVPTAATHLSGALAASGFNPIGVDLSELKKGGGSVKCCTAELRR